MPHAGMWEFMAYTCNGRNENITEKRNNFDGCFSFSFVTRKSLRIHVHRKVKTQLRVQINASTSFILVCN